MPFARPTLTQIIQQVYTDVAASLPGADPLLRFSNLNILSKAVAALANSHYGYQDWIARQAVPYTATEENLEAWAALKGIVRLPATAASGTIQFSGTANGTVIPAGALMVRGDGVQYTTNADATLAAGVATTTVTAVIPAAASNAAAGTVLVMGTALAGVNSNAVATTALTGGADVESDDSLRSRMLAAYSAPAQGGSSTDYVRWAREVPGVTRAWCEPNGMGTGTVVVRFMMDETESAFAGFPQGSNGCASGETRGATATGDQLLVANHIFPLQPVTALVYAAAPVANPINFTLTGTAAWSASLKAEVSAAISAALVQIGVPGAVVQMSYIEAAIAAVPGTAGYVMTVPAANVVQTAGQLPTLGVVTFSP
jgi:uncharacterized phage protein gp47/JayE